MADPDRMAELNPDVDQVDAALAPDELTEFPRYDARRAKAASERYVRERDELGELCRLGALPELSTIELGERLVEQAERVLLAAVALERVKGMSWMAIGAE